MALVGPNGAGKTTIVKLLLGLYKPTSGRIVVDGIDLGDFDGASTRQAFAVVFQDYSKFQLTIRKNIGFGSLEHMDDSERIRRAAILGEADSFIGRLPSGYDTHVGKIFPGGQDLSEGQWQRIAISRAFMRDAQVMIMDEPTASLDARSEYAMNVQAESGGGKQAWVSDRNYSVLEVMARLVGLIARRRPLFLGIVVFSRVIVGVLPAALLLLWRSLLDAAYDVALGHGELRTLVTWVISYVIGSMLLNVISTSVYRVENYTREVLKSILLKEVFVKSSKVRLDLLQYSEFHDLTDRVGGVLESDRFNWFVRSLTDLPTAISTVVSTALVLATFHPYLLFIALLSVIPPTVARMIGGKDYYNKMKHYHTPKLRAMAYLWECLAQRQTAKEIRVFDLSRYFIDSWNSLRGTIYKEEWSYEKRAAMQHAAADVARSISYGIGIVFAAWLMVTGRISPGAFGTSVSAFASVQLRFGHVLIGIAELVENTLFLSLLFRFLDLPTPSGKGVIPDQFKAPGGIAVTLQNVSYSYPGSSSRAIDNVSLSIKRGETVAIVGENGAGKTTLMKLILGLYKPTCGTVLYEGVDLESLDSDEIRKTMSAVFQDYVKYQLTVRENIGFGDVCNMLDDARLHSAIQKDMLDDVIAELPNGIDTVLGREFGDTDLSEGQWQRVAIARGYMRDPLIIAIDEPTASLDPMSEADVFRRFIEMTKGSTSILISHRVGSARIADRIIVMRNGKIVEQGTHDELLQKGGEYAELYKAQAQWYSAAFAAGFAGRMWK